MKMIDVFPWFSVAIAALSVVFLVVAVYAVTRLIIRRRVTIKTDRSVDSVGENIMIIHALVLALVFAQEQVNVLELRHTAAVEAAAVADVFYDLDRYDPIANAE